MRLLISAIYLKYPLLEVHLPGATTVTTRIRFGASLIGVFLIPLLVICFRASIVVLKSHTSDHRLILISALRNDLRGHYRSPRRFHFENWWLNEAECKQVIVRDIDNATGYNFIQSLLVCRESLQRWKHGSHRHIDAEIQRFSNKVHQFHLGDCPGVSGDAITDHIQRLETLLDNKEIRWKQRAKIAWFRNGDRNTSYFHAKADARRRVNRIDGLLDDVGRWCHSAVALNG